MANAAQEVKKPSTEGAQKTTEARVTVVEGVNDPKRTPRRCRFSNIMNYLGSQTIWSCQAFINWHRRRETESSWTTRCALSACCTRRATSATEEKQIGSQHVQSQNAVKDT
jgi:hypothetical protein